MTECGNNHLTKKESSRKKCVNSTGKYLLFFDDFKCDFLPGSPLSPYNYFSAPSAGLIAANDAAGGVNIQSGDLTVNSTPFTYTNANGLDHFKYLVYQEPYNVPVNNIEIVYEAVLSGQQTGLNDLPDVLKAVNGGLTGVNNVNSDIRLASVALNVLDPETFLTCDFILSNEDIYAFYGLLPFGRTEFGGTGPNYTAFSHAIPVGKRNVADPLNDFVKLAIAYNYTENYFRWLINDIEVFRVNRLGFPIERKYRILEHNVAGQLPAPSKLLRPKQLQFGFGTFSLMDMYNPQNPGQLDNAGLVDLSLNQVLPSSNPIVTNVNGTAKAANFLTQYGTLGPNTNGTNFGQGAILRIKYLTVYLLAPDEEQRLFPDLYDCHKELIISRCTQNSIPGVNSKDNICISSCRGKISNHDECSPCPCTSNRCTEISDLSELTEDLESSCRCRNKSSKSHNKNIPIKISKETKKKTRQYK